MVAVVVVGALVYVPLVGDPLIEEGIDLELEDSSFFEAFDLEAFPLVVEYMDLA